MMQLYSTDAKARYNSPSTKQGMIAISRFESWVELNSMHTLTTPLTGSPFVAG